MTFTLVGGNYFPSAAYTPIDAVNGAGEVHIAGPGAGPQDGFTEYPAFGAPVRPRWGDYSAAVADTDGSIWLAVEYIPNAPRDIFANWGVVRHARYAVICAGSSLSGGDHVTTACLFCEEGFRRLISGMLALSPYRLGQIIDGQ
jgi:hypothetical protein